LADLRDLCGNGRTLASKVFDAEDVIEDDKTYSTLFWVVICLRPVKNISFAIDKKKVAERSYNRVSAGACD
jgi:hypothetical protein